MAARVDCAEGPICAGIIQALGNSIYASCVRNDQEKVPYRFAKVQGLRPNLSHSLGTRLRRHRLYWKGCPLSSVSVQLDPSRIPIGALNAGGHELHSRQTVLNCRKNNRRLRQVPVSGSKNGLCGLAVNVCKTLQIPFWMPRWNSAEPIGSFTSPSPVSRDQALWFTVWRKPEVIRVFLCPFQPTFFAVYAQA